MKKNYFQMNALNGVNSKALFYLNLKISELTNCSDSNSISLFDTITFEMQKDDVIWEHTIVNEDKSVGFGNDVELVLSVLNDVRSDLSFSLLLEFWHMFPHRREVMSLSYIAKQLNISVNALAIWLSVENVPMERKKHGLYVKMDDCLSFLINVSRTNYEMKK